MLVVGIIVILLGVAISRIGNVGAIAQDVAVQSDISSITTQLKTYEAMNGFLPTTEQGLHALVNKPTTEPVPSRWHQYFTEVPKDPWRNEYIYLNPGRKNSSGYDLYSAGKDRQPDTADDDWGKR